MEIDHSHLFVIHDHSNKSGVSTGERGTNILAHHRHPTTQLRTASSSRSQSDRHRPESADALPTRNKPGSLTTTSRPAIHKGPASPGFGERTGWHSNWLAWSRDCDQSLRRPAKSDTLGCHWSFDDGNFPSVLGDTEGSPWRTGL